MALRSPRSGARTVDHRRRALLRMSAAGILLGTLPLPAGAARKGDRRVNLYVDDDKLYLQSRQKNLWVNAGSGSAPRLW